MSTFAGYLRGILDQVLASYDVICRLGDGPDDLETMKREWVRIYGTFQSMTRRIEESGTDADAYLELLKRCRYYTQSYYFYREIETMSELYSNDRDRIRNIRIKIVDSLNDRGFMEWIPECIDKLGRV